MVVTVGYLLLFQTVFFFEVACSSQGFLAILENFSSVQGVHCGTSLCWLERLRNVCANNCASSIMSHSSFFTLVYVF